MTPRKAAQAREAKTVFFCAECGNESPKWFGRCPHCDAWNSAREGPGRREAAPARRQGYTASAEAASAPLKLDEIDSSAEARWVSGIGELDRVLGGGLVPGSLVLIGGDPGIGKSTLALQLAAALGRAGRSVLYVSGEESPRQVKLRADRLALRGGLDRLWMQSEIDLERIFEEVERLHPSLLVIDSIQTLYLGSLDAAPGSVSQVRECGLRLLRLTKDGSVAGPRTLEHMVDAVLYLEGERHHEYRILGAAKNRFGSTHEIGVFTMQGDGLAEVENPSERLLKDRGDSVPGSAVVATIEGSRPLLVEV